MSDGINCRRYIENDIDQLTSYLLQLSDTSKSRFGPHPFEKHAIINFYKSSNCINGYLAEDRLHNQLIAYALIKMGLLDHDRTRLINYNVPGIEDNVCTFAPSVADKWQHKGIGKILFNYILDELRKTGIKKIVLWGGVQAGNETAVAFYKKLGFKILGEFEYHGSNLDMMLQLE